LFPLLFLQEQAAALMPNIPGVPGIPSIEHFKA